MSGTQQTTRFIGFYIPVSKNKTLNLLQSVIRQHIPFTFAAVLNSHKFNCTFSLTYFNILFAKWKIPSPYVTQKSFKLVQLFIMISLFFTDMIAVLLCAVWPHLFGKTSAVATRPPIRFNWRQLQYDWWLQTWVFQFHLLPDPWVCMVDQQKDKMQQQFCVYSLSSLSSVLPDEVSLHHKCTYLGAKDPNVQSQDSVVLIKL